MVDGTCAEHKLPVNSATRAATFSAKPIRVLSPVPTAVPPAANMYMWGNDDLTRSIPKAIC